MRVGDAAMPSKHGCSRLMPVTWSRSRPAQGKIRGARAEFGRSDMTRCGLATAAIGLALALGVLTAAPAGAFDRGEVDVLAVLPDVTPGVPSSVEGLTVGPDGNIYVPTFGFNFQGAITGNAVLFVISPEGRILRKLTIPNSSPHLLGLAFNPVTRDLLVLDFGAGQVLKVDPMTGLSSVFVPQIAGSGLNALTFD